MSEKKLKEVFKRSDPEVIYPADKKAATKAEFTTLGRQYKKDKDGCSKIFALGVLVMILLMQLSGVV